MQRLATSNTSIKAHSARNHSESHVSFAFSEPAEVWRIEQIVRRVKTKIRDLGYPQSVMDLDIPLALTEALANAVIHGNHSNPDKQVFVSVSASTSLFRCSVADEGPGFDYSSCGDIEVPDDEPLTHGRGIYLIKTLMSEVSFNKDGNEIDMTLRFPRVGAEVD